MSFIKDKLFERTRIRFIGETNVGQVIPTSRLNSELAEAISLETGGLTPKKKNWCAIIFQYSDIKRMWFLTKERVFHKAPVPNRYSFFFSTIGVPFKYHILKSKTLQMWMVLLFYVRNDIFTNIVTCFRTILFMLLLFFYSLYCFGFRIRIYIFCCSISYLKNNCSNNITKSMKKCASQSFWPCSIFISS